MCQLINSAVLIFLAVGIAWEVKPSCVLGVSGTFCMLVPNVVLLVSLRLPLSSIDTLLLAAVPRGCRVAAASSCYTGNGVSSRSVMSGQLQLLVQWSIVSDACEGSVQYEQVDWAVVVVACVFFITWCGLLVRFTSRSPLPTSRRRELIDRGESEETVLRASA